MWASCTWKAGTPASAIASASASASARGKQPVPKTKPTVVTNTAATVRVVNTQPQAKNTHNAKTIKTTKVVKAEVSELDKLNNSLALAKSRTIQFQRNITRVNVRHALNADYTSVDPDKCRASANGKCLIY